MGLNPVRLTQGVCVKQVDVPRGGPRKQPVAVAADCSGEDRAIQLLLPIHLPVKVVSEEHLELAIATAAVDDVPASRQIPWNGAVSVVWGGVMWCGVVWCGVV